MKKILIGMSGGVDSSVVAAMLKEQGYDVCGVTLILNEGEKPLGEAADAKAVCDVLEIEHRTADFKSLFKEKIITPFVDEYLAGRTPNPCILCNEAIKFGIMLDYALENGFDHIATGHYANIDFNSETGKYRLLKTDSKKDQSYFLYRLNQHQLAHAFFPAADMEKEQIRALAEKYKLPVAKKSDSQEICFVPNDDYASFITAFDKECTIKCGNFTDTNGNVIGQHKGIINYTVGQRRGIGVGFGKPMYVLDIDPEKNTVTLGDNRQLFSSNFTVSNINYISGETPTEPFEAEVKIRFRAPYCPAKITPLGDRCASVELLTPQRAITPGQSAVFCNGNEILGGGYIDTHHTN